MITIQRVSQLTGKVHTMEVPATEEQFMAWRNGALIQNAMPACSPEQREFIMTGITPEEWKEHIEEQQRKADEEAAAKLAAEQATASVTEEESAPVIEPKTTTKKK